MMYYKQRALVRREIKKYGGEIFVDHSAPARLFAWVDGGVYFGMHIVSNNENDTIRIELNMQSDPFNVIELYGDNRRAAAYAWVDKALRRSRYVYEQAKLERVSGIPAEHTVYCELSLWLHVELMRAAGRDFVTWARSLPEIERLSLSMHYQCYPAHDRGGRGPVFHTSGDVLSLTPERRSTAVAALKHEPDLRKALAASMNVCSHSMYVRLNGPYRRWTWREMEAAQSIARGKLLTELKRPSGGRIFQYMVEETPRESAVWSVLPRLLGNQRSFRAVRMWWNLCFNFANAAGPFWVRWDMRKETGSVGYRATFDPGIVPVLPVYLYCIGKFLRTSEDASGRVLSGLREIEVQPHQVELGNLLRALLEKDTPSWLTAVLNATGGNFKRETQEHAITCVRSRLSLDPGLFTSDEYNAVREGAIYHIVMTDTSQTILHVEKDGYHSAWPVSVCVEDDGRLAVCVIPYDYAESTSLMLTAHGIRRYSLESHVRKRQRSKNYTFKHRVNHVRAPMNTNDRPDAPHERFFEVGVDTYASPYTITDNDIPVHDSGFDRVAKHSLTRRLKQHFTFVCDYVWSRVVELATTLSQNGPSSEANLTFGYSYPILVTSSNNYFKVDKEEVSFYAPLYKERNLGRVLDFVRADPHCSAFHADALRALPAAMVDGLKEAEALHVAQAPRRT